MKKLISIFIILSVLFPKIGFSQNDEIDDLFLKVDSLKKSSKHQQSIILLKNSRFLNKTSNIYFARIYNSISTSYRLLFEADSSLKYAHKTLQIDTTKVSKHQILVAYQNLGEAYRLKGDFENSLHFLNECLSYSKLDFPSDISSANLIKGNVYVDLGNYEKALLHYQESLSLHKNYLNQNEELNFKNESFNNEKSTLINLYNNLGAVFFYQHQYELALSYFKQALNAGILNYGKNHLELIDFYINIGATYQLLKNYNQSFRFYIKSLAISDSILGVNHLNSAYIYNNLGELYSEQSNYEKALQFFQKAIKIKRSFLSENHASITYTKLYIGNTFSHLNKPKKAKKYYFETLQAYLNNYEIPNPKITQTYHIIGEFFYNRTQLDSASYYFNKAINSNLIKTKNKEIERQSTDPNLLFKSYLHLSKSYKELFLKKKQSSYLDKAHHIYQKADLLVTQIQKSYTNYKDKIFFINEASALYNEAVESFFFDDTPNNEWVEKAFYYSQRSKSNILLESLTELEAKHTGIIPESKLEREYDLKTLLNYYQSQIIQLESSDVADNSEKISQKQNKLFDIEQQYNSFLDSLAEEYPRYWQLKHQSEGLTIKQIQHKTKSNEAVLEYFVGKTNIIVFIITQNTFSAEKIPLQSNTYTNIESLVKQIKKPYINSPITLGKLSHEIYQNLIKKTIIKLPKKINHLTIIPDGVLSYLPFETLVTKEINDTIQFHNKIPYLINDYVIQYAYSSNLINKSTIQKKQENFLLAFAPQYENNQINQLEIENSKSPTRSSLANLRYNVNEVKGVSKYADGLNYLTENATETNFKRKFNKSSIIHLAMHATVNNNKPLESKLIFSNSIDSLEDGFLHAFEIYKLKTNAELVVLSACETANGELAKGEGVLSLGRAFSYAGSPSVIISHWPVDDKATATLMTSFYQFLSEGYTKSEALREAKLKYIQNSDILHSSPFFWGAFVMIGDDKPVFEKSKSTYMYLLITVALFALVFLYFKITNLNQKNSQPN